ncbi:MAG: hypothetical protein LWX09_06085 [Bacteroidia bacterium]|nr:hypothetical protein [Bacteroidia bacterium]
MRASLKILVVLILLVNTIGAFYGGYSLLADPTGGLLQMPLDYLKHSPFSNYFWPGLILFVVNGLFGLLTLLTVILRHKLARTFVIIQGILLGGWISMQMILLQIFYPPLHLPFLLMGAVLLLIGWLMPQAISRTSITRFKGA